MKGQHHGTLAAAIGRAIGARKIETAPEILVCYSFDATNIRNLPLAVAFPETTRDVTSIVELCSSAGAPIIPRGAGTGLAGGSIPPSGGIVVSTERLNRIISVDREAMTALVEPGVVNAALQAEAAKSDLMFPPDPSSLEVCTLGGNVAQDAGGPRALKYGVTRDYVAGVEAVLYDGRVVACGEDGPRQGWNPLIALLVGSEGTLGVLTRLRLKLKARPTGFATALAFFRSTREAAVAVNLVFECGALPAALELIDADTMACIASFVKIEAPVEAGCSLLIETDGTGDEARETMAQIESAIGRAAPLQLRVARSEEERQDLWRMRRSVSPSLARIAPWKINEDVCVPRSRLPLLVDAVGALARKYGLRVPAFGHAGDGNLHVNIMFDRRKADETKRAQALAAELFDATLNLQGTISGEHGVGLTKMEFLPRQLGPDGLKLQRRIKWAFDPRALINPGKVTGAV